MTSFHTSPVFQRGNHINKFHTRNRLAATSGLDDTTYIPKARVAQHRDVHDEWLERMLFRRSGKSHASEAAPIFDTAAMVVEHFLSPNENEAGDGTSDLSNKPLRRIPIDDSNIEEPHWSEQMFASLFDVRPSCERIQSSKEVPLQGRMSQRTNLKITLAYRGVDFCGWEDQRHELYRSHGEHLPGAQDESGGNNSHTMPSVQGTLVDVLDPLLGSKHEKVSTSINDESGLNATSRVSMQKTRRNRSSSKPIVIKVAGRTDAGVSAISQVCRIRTFRAIDCVEKYVMDTVNENVSKCGVGLRIRDVECVGDDFHPTFGATSRAYAYIIDLDDGEVDDRDQRRGIPARLVPKLDLMLRAIEGKELDYVALSYGKVKTKTTLCKMYRARAEIIEWRGLVNLSPETIPKRAVCIQLVGDRFLRRMVRILVATALREANRDGNCSDALLDIIHAKDRRNRATAAPPDGLVFVGAGY